MPHASYEYVHMVSSTHYTVVVLASDEQKPFQIFANPLYKSSPPQSSWSVRNPNEGETADNHRQHQVHNDVKPLEEM